MARKTRLTPYGEQIVEAFDLGESGSEFTSYRSTPSMATKDDFPSDDPVPLFLSDHTEEPEPPPDTGKVWDRTAISLRNLKRSIFVVTVAAIVFAILWVGNPIAIFANTTASLVGISAPQSSTGQQFQAWAAGQDARAQTPTIQSTAGARALPPTARDAPTRDEIAAAFKTAHQNQTEISQPTAEALFEQFQAWAAEQDARAQVPPVQKQR
jgi:hypothetical protein